MEKKYPISLWDRSAREPDFAQALDGDVSTSVAIVGGGFTGLSTALHLAELGIDCHVLEAEQIGYGGSGRNVGLVNAGLWLPPQEIRAVLGPARGEQLVTLLGEAPAYVFSLIDKHKIRCEPTRSGTLHAAPSPSGVSDLQARCDEWRRLGAPVELLDKQQTAQRVGCDLFHAALLDHRAGTINPMGYVRGLARAARAAGARISTGCRVQQLSRQGGNWLLRTASGSVSASSVVLGTNAYTDSLWPQLDRVFTLVHYFQLASEPLGERAQQILPEGQGLWTTGAIMFNLRRDVHGRIMIGSMGKIRGAEKGLSERWARRRLQRIFPQLGLLQIEHSWHGQIAMTPDHLPRILHLDDKLYAATGYNGRGITTGTILGRAMAGLLHGDTPGQLPLALSRLQVVNGARYKSRLYEAVFAAHKLAGSFF